MIFIYPFLELTGVNKKFFYRAPKDCNSLPTDLKETYLLSIFKSELKTFLKDFD